MFSKKFFSGRLHGEGGVISVLQIALPMVVSQGSETLMMFIDRLFLSRLGGEYLAAAMSGGLTAFMFMTFFFGLIGYTNALVAQYYGSGRRKKCAVAVTQSLIVAVASYPLILCCLPLGWKLFELAGHEPAQIGPEKAYYTILLFGSIIGLVRVGLSSFFSGIGRATIIMVSAIVSLLINVGANYVLIYGKFGVPAMGIRGAAYGTVIGNACGLLVMVLAYFSASNRSEFGTAAGFKSDRESLGILLRFGYPAGLEFFMNLTAFNLFVQFFHSYGRDVAAAVTIVFNWDLVSFFPMIGINIATMSLVGRYMGANQPAMAERSTYSGLLVAYCYSGSLLLLFLLMPRQLVAVFAVESGGVDYSEAAKLAVPMLRLAAVYTMSDATFLVFGGALRGAGDTRWTMRASVLLHWLMAVVCLFLIRVVHASPMVTWMVFVGLVFLMGITFFLRFRTGIWKSIRMLGENPPENPPHITI